MSFSFALSGMFTDLESYGFLCSQVFTYLQLQQAMDYLSHKDWCQEPDGHVGLDLAVKLRLATVALEVASPGETHSVWTSLLDWDPEVILYENIQSI